MTASPEYLNPTPSCSSSSSPSTSYDGSILMAPGTGMTATTQASSFVFESDLKSWDTVIPAVEDQINTAFWKRFEELPDLGEDLDALFKEIPTLEQKPEDSVMEVVAPNSPPTFNSTMDSMKNDNDYMWTGYDFMNFPDPFAEIVKQPLLSLDMNDDNIYNSDVIHIPEPPPSPDYSPMVCPQLVSGGFVRPSTQKTQKVIVERGHRSLLKKDDSKENGKRPDTPQSSESEEEQVKSYTARTPSWRKTSYKLQEAQKRAVEFDHNYDSKSYRPEELGVQTPSDSEADEEAALLERELTFNREEYMKCVEEEVEDGEENTDLKTESGYEVVQVIKYEDEEMIDIESVSRSSRSSSPGQPGASHLHVNNNCTEIISPAPAVFTYDQTELTSEPINNVRTSSNKRQKRQQPVQPRNNKRQRRQTKEPRTSARRSNANSRNNLPTNPKKNIIQIEQDFDSAMTDNLLQAQNAVSQRLNGSIKKCKTIPPKRPAVVSSTNSAPTAPPITTNYTPKTTNYTPKTTNDTPKTTNDTPRTTNYRGRGRKPGNSRKTRFSNGQKMDEEKRNQHNNMERMRRVELRDLFDRARTLVPSLKYNLKAAKVAILNGAVRHIKQLEKEQVERERLVRELARKRDWIANKVFRCKAILHTFPEGRETIAHAHRQHFHYVPEPFELYSDFEVDPNENVATRDEGSSWSDEE